MLQAQLAMPSMYSRKHLRHSIVVEEGAMHPKRGDDSATASLDCACCVRHVVHRRLSDDLPGTAPLFGIVGLQVAPLLGLGLSGDINRPLSPRLHRCRSQHRTYCGRSDGTTAAIVEAQRLETCQFSWKGMWMTICVILSYRYR